MESYKHKKAFRRVRSNDDLPSADQTTVAVLVEILRQSEPSSAVHQQHRHHHHHCHQQQQQRSLERPRSLHEEGTAGLTASLGAGASPVTCDDTTIGDITEAVSVTTGSSEEVSRCAKVIASKLKKIGDQYQSTIDQRTLSDVLAIFVDHQDDGSRRRFEAILEPIMAEMSLPRVLSLFRILHEVISYLLKVFGKKPYTQDPRWSLFQDLLQYTIQGVDSWICIRGGWLSLIGGGSISSSISTSSSPICSPPQSPLVPTRGRVFSLSETGEFVDEHGAPTSLSSSLESRSSCELHPSYSTVPISTCVQVEAAAALVTNKGSGHFEKEEDKEEEDKCQGSHVSPPIPIPVPRCTASDASTHSPFDRLRSGSLPVFKRDRSGRPRTSSISFPNQVALVAYMTVASYLTD